MADTRFSFTSRYRDSALGELSSAEGGRIVYLRRRFVPDPSRFVTVHEYRVVEGDRIDRMAGVVLGDPEQFWRLLDANGCLHPLELEEVGRMVRLTLPENLLGPPRA